jgi:glycerol transport system ATP-binding protein
LKNRGVAKSAIAARVAEIAALLDLTPVLDRKATRLTADASRKFRSGAVWCDRMLPPYCSTSR